MEEFDLKSILNYQKVHDRLATSGQPTKEQFDSIRAAGFNVVINLALTNASNALQGEDQIVLTSGMDYIHLPLSWDTPSTGQALYILRLIDNLLNSAPEKKIWLHCALNYRVSSLMLVYRTQIMKFSIAEALSFLHQFWSPNPTWQALIDKLVLEKI